MTGGENREATLTAPVIESTAVRLRWGSSFVPPSVRGPIVDRLAWTLVFLCAGVAVAWFRTLHLDEAAALYGFSPSALLDPLWGRPEFAADFPNGEAPMMASLVGQAYHGLGFLPLSRRLAVAFMIFAEFCALGAGAYFVARAANPKLPAWTSMAAALLLTTGGLVSCDLARWFHPYYGSAYNFAYGFGFAAVAAILRRKPIWAGFWLGLTAAVHPILGLFFGLAVGAIALVGIAGFRFSRLVAGGLVALALAGGWTWLMLGGTGISGDAVDPRLYIALTRLMSFHWFPITIGVFSDRAFETSIPFAGFMLVVVAVLRPFSSTAGRRDAQIGAAVLFLLAVTAVGVFASEYSGIPFLVKLALHRASSVALLIGAIVLVPRLAGDVISGSIVRAPLAAALLLLSFWRDHGPPILLCVLFAAVVLVEERARLQRVERALLVAAIIVVVALVAVFYRTGAMPAVFVNANLGFATLREPLFLIALVLAALAWLLRLPVVLALAFAGGAFAWTPQADLLRDPGELQRAQAFLEVQQWASANTPPDALFMIDPAYAYGWREISERPSFGTLREWLYSGWIYDTKAPVFDEGLKRAKWLGLDLGRYLGRSDVAVAYGEMWQQARNNYDSMDAGRLKEGAATFGISYFVFDRRNAPTLPNLPVVFENERYAVLSAAR